MEVREIKQKIRTTQLDNFYIFDGDEIYVQKAYINKIAEVTNKTLQYIDSVTEVYKGKGMSLFNTSYCYVCRDDIDFMKSEKAWENIEKLVGNNILIFLVTKIDKRGKFYKHFADKIVTFEYLDTLLLTKYIQKDCDMSDGACAELISVCENDYNKIRLELDKIKCYASQCSLDIDAILDKFLVDGTIHKPPRDVIFEWVDAVLSGKPRKSFKLLDECIELGEPPLRLLLVLYNNTKHLLQVQSCPSRDISKITGLSSWEIRQVQNKVGVYSNRELVDALHYIRNAEVDIKTGRIEADIAVPYVMSFMLY